MLLGRRMIGVLVASLVAGLSVCAAAVAEPLFTYGGRSPKTMTDSAASLVKLTAKPTTVAWLRHLRPRGVLGPRTPGIETTTFRIQVRLVAAKNEDDGDIHLIVRGIDPNKQRHHDHRAPAPALHQTGASAVPEPHDRRPPSARQSLRR
jgi:hypothetical protein